MVAPLAAAKMVYAVLATILGKPIPPYFSGKLAANIPNSAYLSNASEISFKTLTWPSCR